MSVFDEVEQLSTSCREMDLEIGRVRDLVTQLSRLIHTIKNQLSSAEAKLQGLNERLKFMKSTAPVVLLSEYEHTAFQRRETLDVLAVKRQEIQKLEKQAVTASKSLPALEEQKQRLLAQYAQFGKVLEFRP